MCGYVGGTISKGLCFAEKNAVTEHVVVFHSFPIFDKDSFYYGFGFNRAYLLVICRI